MNWRKIWLIMQREYESRVMKKSFWVLTLLIPLLFLIFFIVVGFIFAYEGDEKLTIAVLDEADLFKRAIPDQDGMYFQFSTEDLNSLKESVKAKKYSGILVIPAIKDVKSKSIQPIYYSDDQLPLGKGDKIKDLIHEKVRDYKLATLGIPKEKLDYIDTKINLEPEPVSEKTKNTTSATTMVGAGLGYIMSMIMFFITFFYGTFVMRGVHEEKLSRINEIIISSVKPFELMLGKIIGIGGVGLTQILLWAVLMPLVSTLAAAIMPAPSAEVMNMNTQAGSIPLDELNFQAIFQEIMILNWWFILPVCALYFLGGFFIYASLFAAVASAMGDDINEGQNLTLPITLPVILGLYIAMSILRSPNSSMAVWASLFPLISPTVMPARLAFHPPLWQVVLSLILLLGGAVACVWLAGRIYRTGILMYGKKASFKEIGKWLFYKD